MNGGLPHYVAINQMPENGCEIQTACCGTSSTMMTLRIVKQEELEGEKSLKHGLKVMLTLLNHWAPRGRVICADSYFASVQAAIELYKRGWKLIGVVKTSHKMFPKKFLEKIALPDRGTFAGLPS
jgi:Transposase IS4